MPMLEFCLPPGALPHLLRHAAFARRGGRATPVHLVWHDTANGALAADHLSLCETGALWRLERASPRKGEAWPPATPAPLVAEAADPAALGKLPEPLLPIAAFHGERRVIRLAGDAPASLTILHGVLRGVTQERALCRLTLEGPAALLAALSDSWAAQWPLTVPDCSVALEALAVARGLPNPARHSGGPAVPPGTSIADAVALVVGHLTDVILAGMPTAMSGDDGEAVHAMRVAVRRLRSALSVFRRAVDAPSFTALKDQLGHFARRLGAARDWDVFLAGVCADVAAAMPGDKRLEALLHAAARRRQSAYDALRREFASPEFRLLLVGLVQLAALRTWAADADPDRLATLETDVADFAAAALSRQHRRLLAAGEDLDELPAEALHALRKQGKKLRYTTEFFVQCLADRRARRFLDRLEDLQEALGALNDGAAAANLLQALRGGADQQFAAGVVQGFTLARAAASRASIGKRWAKFRSAKPFWL